MTDLRVRVGVDVVAVERVRELIARPAFLERTFQPSERAVVDPERLAGVFAAKEALFKALETPRRFEAVAVVHDGAGRPSLALSPDVRPPDLVSLDLSISHERELAIAVVVALFVPTPVLIPEELGE